jgi:hypothetical protein
MSNTENIQAAQAAINMPMRQDPILQELWDIKAELNKKANYDVGQVLANARAFAAQFHGPDGRVRVQSN